MMELNEELLKKVADIWRNKRFQIVLSGAGISVASGIPDFRSPGGVWTKFDPMEVGTAEALNRNPKKVWEFFLHTLEVLEKAKPNPAHYALAELEKEGFLKGIITQNVDNLHQLAGSKNVIEYHGTAYKFYCRKCKKDYSLSEVKAIIKKSMPPYCECGGLIRPDVVFFGEGIPPDARYKADLLANQADLILIVGTSGEVAPANFIPHIVKHRGGVVVEVNLGETTYKNLSDFRFNQPCEIVLPKLKDLILKK